MTKQIFTCAETAKLVRSSLKEAFPGVKFSVRGREYSGGASIRVEWLDGPTAREVEQITNRFKASYFDGSIDYQGSIHQMMDGKQVIFGADYIFTERQHSDEAVAFAIDAVYMALAQNFKADGFDKPTVEQFRKGALLDWRLSGVHADGNANVQADVRKAMSERSAFDGKAKPSKTAGRVFVTHDDNYSRQHGCGMSAVPCTVLF